MKRSVLTAVLMVFFLGAFAQPGVLDQTFGYNGQVRIPVPLGDRVHPVDLKLQPDQKILVLVTADTGQSWSDTENFFKYQLFRFNPDGTPDNTFGTNGSTLMVDRQRPVSMELLTNGKILLNTASYDGQSTHVYPYHDSINLCLTRYNANGTIDNTFGTNGKTITPIDTTTAIATGLIILPNGKIIQTGIAFVPLSSNTTPSHTVLVGYDQNGNIDPSFGSNGIVKVQTAGYIAGYYGYYNALQFSNPLTCLLQSNQRIVVTADSGMYRFSSNGILDATFGTNGFASYPPGYTWNVHPSPPWKLYQSTAFAGLVEPNDKIMLVKYTTPDSTIPWNRAPIMACRFNANGSADTTFPNFMINPDDGSGLTNSKNPAEIFLEPNGQYTIAISITYPGFGATGEIIKVNSNGTADSAYGKRGRIPLGYDRSPNIYFGLSGNAATLQPDGKFLVAGVVDTAMVISQSWTYPQKAWAIRRYEKNARLKYNTLVSDVFYDQNSNGIKDANETPFMGYQSTMTIKTGRTDTAYWYGQWPTYQAGLQDVDTGSYHTSVRMYNQPYYTVVPAIKTTSHNTYWNTDTLHFAVQPIANIRDLAVNIIGLNKARPGFPVDYLLKVHNAGTDSAGNVVVKMVKSDKVVYNSATVSPASVVADTIVWNIAGLQSQQDAFIIVHGTVKAPPLVNINDLVKAVASITSDKTDTLTTNDTSFLWQYATGAYDPNDKTENHGGKITHAKAVNGEYLTYTIRFQNKGNDTAFNVYIRDTMDSKLDWNSLQIVASSHNYKMTMNDGRCLFTFPFIMLVDSIKNEPKSHGYIVYKIKAKQNVQIGDVIKNTAAIYFDYNLPIFTNTEMTTVEAEVLPLKVLNFTVRKQDKTNLLNWTTAQEINVDRFEIERSSNGREFSKIGIVRSELAVGSVHNYSYTDNNPFASPLSNSVGEGPGVWYYRLKMVDKDGKFQYSPVRQITTNNSPLTISIYPNPAKDNLQVQIDSDKKTALQLIVLSGDGKTLLSKSITASEGCSLQSINISTLPKGSYLLKASCKEGEQVVKFEKL